MIFFVRRQQVAKIFDKSMERMLVVYLRSLGSAMEDATRPQGPRSKLVGTWAAGFKETNPFVLNVFF